MLPSGKQIFSAVEDRFVMEDWHNFGADYDKTLMCWFQSFKDSWEILSQEYDHRFYRMWIYYLLACAGCFRARAIQSWQIVLAPHGIRSGFHYRR